MNLIRFLIFLSVVQLWVFLSGVTLEYIVQFVIKSFLFDSIIYTDNNKYYDNKYYDQLHLLTHKNIVFICEFNSEHTRATVVVMFITRHIGGYAKAGGGDAGQTKCRLDYNVPSTSWWFLWNRVNYKTTPCDIQNEGIVKHKNGQTVTNSGGKCVDPSTCIDCNIGYYPTTEKYGYCKACPSIDKCNVPSCSSPHDVICDYCVGEYIESRRGYNVYTGLPDRKSCQQACSWRNGARCFPGSCGENYILNGKDERCTCADGFGGKNCAVANADNTPNILEMEMALIHEDRPSFKVDTLNSSFGEIFWTKETDWEDINLTLKASYKPNFHGEARPNYITNYMIGLEYMDTKLTLQRGNSQYKWDVNGACAKYTELCPKTLRTSLSSVTAWQSIFDGKFKHEDRITITMNAKNGGIIYYEHREGFDISKYKNMSYLLRGRTLTETRHLGFDEYPPTHCLEQHATCLHDALTVEDFIKQANVTAYWNGWEDTLSGVASYTCHVYHLQLLNGSNGVGELTKGEMITPVTSVDDTQSSMSLYLEEPGPYTVELIVTDKAGNTKKARRIIMFDNDSVIDKIGSLPNVVQAGNGDWINTSSSNIELQWNGRYRNVRHSNYGWLNAVAYDDDISRELDDNSGNSLRTVDRIHNIEGIVRIEIARHSLLGGQHESGEFETIPLNYFDEQHMVYPTDEDDLVDGKKMIYSIRAFDVLDEYAEDNVTVMIDLSPPVVDNFWLSKGDVVNISVHNVKELADLTIEFVTFDVHSGIDVIYWSIFDNFTSEVVVHGNSGTSAQGETTTLEECKTEYGSYARGPNCYCTPYNGCYHQHHQIIPPVTDTGDDGLHYDKQIGEHEFDYFIQVTAINNAGLNTTKYKKITIDVSPPTEGTVHDGIPGEPEVDFQQSLQLSAYWDGFFDKESDVWFYTYGFHDTCLNESMLDVHMLESAKVQIFKTYSTTAHATVPTLGKYYVTVMVYNHALDHSKAVCSDGVTINDLPAVVTEVVIQGAVTEQGLLKDSSTGNVFVLSKNREIESVYNPSTSCIENSLTVPSDLIDTLPRRRTQNGSMSYINIDNNCDRPQRLSTNFRSWIRSDNSIYISWNVSNIDQVHDFEVGIASEDNDFPDVFPFTSTRQHQHTRIYHPDIFNGEIFFILIKSITKSMIIDKKSIGPVVYDSSKPIFSGQISLSKEVSPLETFLIAWWDNDEISDESGQESLTYQVAIGTKQNAQDILLFSEIRIGGSCLKSDPPSCSAFPTSTLPWHLHSEQRYVVTLKITNVAGLFVTKSSEEYQHNIVLPSRGVVHDINADNASAKLFADIVDIDFQPDNTTLRSRWTGFNHPHEDISYTVCLSNSKQDNFLLCEESNGEDTHVFTNIILQAYVTYYQVVIAQTEAGNVSATSDGVTVVIEGDTFDGISLYDGPDCNKTSQKVSDINLSTSHHDENKITPYCDERDYQSSTSVLESHWRVVGENRNLYNVVYQSVQEKAPVAEYWTTYLDYQRLEAVSFHVELTDLFLTPGRCYRHVIKLCASEYCYKPVNSDGVCVISTPPTTGNISVTYLENISTINVAFDKFYDPDMIEIKQARKVMDHYEWAISDDSYAGSLVYKWTRIQPSDSTHNEITASLVLEDTLPTDKCFRLCVRGYTKSGLSSVVCDEIRNCSDIYKVAPNIVIDAIGGLISSNNKHKGNSIFLQKNDIWKHQDVDYTPYNNILSSVWPSLRHGDYIWAVLCVSQGESTMFYGREDLPNLKDPCSHPDAIKCGRTDLEFVNVEFSDGEMVHGKRYITCVHADATVLHHEFWDQELDEISSCSDGVTVDLTPPTPGDVWIGNNKEQPYQTSTSEINVNWNSFIDVEEGGTVIHKSGVTNYEVAIGSSAGGSDMVTFTNVGLTNHKIFHDVPLQVGHTYFATVKGYDFTGQSAVSMSTGVKVDTTPPEITNSNIKLVGRHITDKQYVEACWESVFYDTESGLSHYSWAVGTHPGLDDVSHFIDTNNDCDRSSLDDSLQMTEGHAYYISVKAYNKAGLYSSISSWAFVVDESAPLPGTVYDGPLVDNVYKDRDYIQDASVVNAHWKGFVEQHSTLAEYFIQVGSCDNCSDVLTKQSIGINNEIELHHVRLSEGKRYYVTITACNTADLCSSASSDGFIVDSTPPIRGVVIDGITSSDITYQASTNSLACKWYGFIDPQSGISHYTWRIGTTRGGDDILQTRNVIRHEEAFVFDYLKEYGHKLPVGVKMYCTVRAYNKAGEYSESSSNGFTIDNTAPLFSKNLSQSSIGSIIPGTSVLRTVLKVNWDIHDNESFIETQHLSMSSHISGDFNQSSITIEGVARDYTFTGLDLHDGSFYDVQLISCNGAKMCASSSLTILMDSSPPSPGMFAINTDHAADLNRQPDEWMIWTPISIKLAWLGFEDVHTGIESYSVNIGSRYMGSDLNEISNEQYKINHYFNESVEDSSNNGDVQTSEFRTKRLKSDIDVFISIFAYNKVGLRSSIVHAQFKLVFGGFMALVRRCEAHTCLGHCVCAPHDKLCESRDSMCNVVSGNERNNSLVEVEDYLDLTFPDTTEHVSYSLTNTMLAATWSVKDQGVKPLWFEWSIGLTSEDTPLGIFDTINDRVWHDAGQLKLNVFTIPRDKPTLRERETYSYFVRAWYDSNTFAVFKSKGITIHSTPPQTISIRGKSVKEILFGGAADIDFITRQSNVIADWSGKFNGVSAYRLYLSTSPTGHDFYSHNQDIRPDDTNFNISGLPFQEHTKYFTIIQAFNEAGLHTTEVSDGFSLDLDPPATGVVMDGFAVSDQIASSDVHSMSSFWHSFADTGSGIVSYEYCIHSNDIPDSQVCNVKPIGQVGIGTHIRFTPEVPFKQGQTLKGGVRVRDAVGHVSDIVYSDGIIIDTTAPERVEQDICNDNVVYDSSFENLYTKTNEDVCGVGNDSYWQLSPGSCLTAVNVTEAHDGVITLHLRGSISQDVDTTEGRYRLTFHTSVIPSNSLLTKSTVEGYISVNGDRHIFLLYRKPRTNAYYWQKHTFHFNIVKNQTKVMIGSVDERQIAIDSVSLDLCSAVDDKIVQSDGHVKTHTVFVHDWSTIYADWKFVDAESPIVQYLWAIGTVKGGTQLQDFKNVGQRTFASNHRLRLLHNTEVYITVVAVNAAGLRSVSYSDTVIIDLTPPVCNYVNDGHIHGDDIDFQKGLEVHVYWDITDPESGIQECQFAVGVHGDETSIQDYSHVTEGQNNATITLEQIFDGIIYYTILCTNFAGLTSKCASDGVRIIDQPPSIDNVVLDLMTTSETQFKPRGNYHGNKTEIRFRWAGFDDDDGIASYLISLQGGSHPTTEIVKASHSAYEYAGFTGLDLTDGDYAVSVVALNEIKMQSQKKSSTFILLTQAPSITGQPISTFWDTQTSVASAHWKGVFSYQHPMFYEVTIRMVDYGEGDLLQWQETTNTFIENVLDVDEIPDGGVTVRFSIRAVGFSGLFAVAHGDLYVFL